MPSSLKSDIAGYYYVTNLGVNSFKVFHSQNDKDVFLQIIDKIALSHNVILHSHVLMDNHYNLLIETKQENLSSFMNIVNENYGYYLDKTYKQQENSWQDCYNSKYIENEKYLYIVLKQMKAVLNDTSVGKSQGLEIN